MKLFFDTETTAKANYELPPDAPGQPRLVQLGAILTTDDCESVSTVNLMVKPNGFIIPQEASNVHGIQHDVADAYGMDARAAVFMFVNMCMAAKTICAFNLEYDKLVMEGEISRVRGMLNPFNTSGKEFLCEMLAMTDICRLPPKYSKPGFKWPSLQEAYKRAYGVSFDGSHDALADVRATIDVHRWRTMEAKTTL